MWCYSKNMNFLFKKNILTGDKFPIIKNAVNVESYRKAILFKGRLDIVAGTCIEVLSDLISKIFVKKIFLTCRCKF